MIKEGAQKAQKRKRKKRKSINDFSLRFLCSPGLNLWNIRSGSYYFEQCDLRRTAVAQRDDDGSESPVDVKLSRAELRVAPHQAAAGPAQPAGGLFVFASGEQPPVDLTAVRVA